MSRALTCAREPTRRRLPCCSICWTFRQACGYRRRCCGSIRCGIRCATTRVSRRYARMPRMDELLRRLRERKLVQWALAYIAAAFALIQVLDVVAQRFGWPDALERVLILALVLGFFVTLVLAWYHGEKGAQKVTGAELLILALLLGIGGALVWRMAQ